MSSSMADRGGVETARRLNGGSVPRLVLAGTASGVGKTSLAVGIMAALRARGRSVAPFKAGPDYIDPTYHGLAAGRPSRNLDSWLLPPANLLTLFQRAAAASDLALVEGGMGLFDGRSGGGEAGSTAELAKLLRAPVVLVLDVGKQARSAAAVARGFQTFDPTLDLAGFILNRVGSARHADLVKREVEAVTGRPVLGALPKSAEVELPERHLGLIPSSELGRAEAVVGRLGELVAEHLDLDTLLRLAEATPPPPVEVDELFPTEPRQPSRRLAVARDEAFSFYYEDNLDLLAAHGAELAPFSPLRDEALPAGADGLYLGGGFPELFAERLAANRPLLEDLRRAAGAGLPIYAECGGLMYLAEQLTDFNGARHTMAGLLPCQVAMTEQRMALGYVKLRTRRDTLLSAAGRELRGHEFHWSRLSAGAELADAYDVLEPSQRREGFASTKLLASYVHLHFGSAADLAPGLVAAL